MDDGWGYPPILGNLQVGSSKEIGDFQANYGFTGGPMSDKNALVDWKKGFRQEK